jgi:hypothetical protein
VKRVITPVVELADGRRYGYQWYLGADMAGTLPSLCRWVGGIGSGGQRRHVFTGLGVVTAIKCGNYGKTGMEQTRVVNAVLSEAVLPAFVRRAICPPIHAVIGTRFFPRL